MDWKEINAGVHEAKRARTHNKKRTIVSSLLAATGINPTTVAGTDDAIRQVECVVRKMCAAENGIVPGKLVTSLFHRKPLLVSCIDSLGYIRCKNAKGSFSPFSLTLYNPESPD